MNNEIATVKPAYLSNLNPLDNECPVGMEDIKIPSIVLAQPASKAMVETDPGYIDGLRPGQFYNSVTREVYGKSVKVQFVHYFKTYQVFKGEEWQEALPEAEFKKLRNVQFDKKNGFLTPDKPDCFIRENWRIVLMLPEYNSFDFVFLNVKPGGIGEAKQWVNQMFAKFQNGEPINAIVWEINSYLKQSSTSNNPSYQIEGARIKAVGYVGQEQYEKAIKIKDQIKASQEAHISTGEDY